MIIISPPSISPIQEKQNNQFPQNKMPLANYFFISFFADLPKMPMVPSAVDY